MGSILGIGVDVVDVKRMKVAIDAWGPALVKKMFTETEVAYCKSKKKPHEHFAARFAAKEAVSKAMETGWSGQFRWRDVEVVNEISGAPKVVLHDYVASQLAQCKVHVSLSHTENTVVAFAIIEKKE
ncbi:MAG TPA: holo-[acyl-carrier-protein] synthase [Bacteroidetes bacterium]|nr:holo-[acyl-carrier-protein] synthase [Bacteroidota bacterium]